MKLQPVADNNRKCLEKKWFLLESIHRRIFHIFQRLFVPTHCHYQNEALHTVVKNHLAILHKGKYIHVLCQ